MWPRWGCEGVGDRGGSVEGVERRGENSGGSQRSGNIGSVKGGLKDKSRS